MAQDNVELLRGTYEAFGRGDVAAVLGSFADDITWHAPAVLPQGGDARGRRRWPVLPAPGRAWEGLSSTCGTTWRRATGCA